VTKTNIVRHTFSVVA